MAKLTDRLPLTEGTNRPIADPVPVSGLASALGFASNALEGFASLRAEEVRRKKAEKAAEKEALEDAAYAESLKAIAGARDSNARQNQQVIRANEANAVAPTAPAVTGDLPSGGAVSDDYGSMVGDGPSAIFEKAAGVGASPAPTALTKEASNLARKAVVMTAAVDQGRIPEVSMSSTINATFRQLLDKYPDFAAREVMKAFKDAGADANLFTEVRDAAAIEEAERDAQAQRIKDRETMENNAVKAAVEAHGPEALAWPRERQITEGLTVQQQQFELQRRTTEMNILSQQVNIDKTQKEMAEQDLSDGIAQTLRDGVYTASRPLVKQLGDLANSLDVDPNNPASMARFQALSVQANQGVSAYVDAAMATLPSNFRGDREALRKQLETSFQPILDLFTGDASVVAAKTNALKAIETSLKIDTAIALPLYTQLKGSGFKIDEIPAIMQGIEADPKFMKQLKDELNGYKQDILEDGASTRFRRILGALRRQNQTEPRDISILSGLTNSLAKGYIRKPKDVDPNLLVNSVGEVTIQLRELSGNSPAAMAGATNAFANSTIRQSLIAAKNSPNVDQEALAATITASRAGSAQILGMLRMTLPKVNRGNTRFQVVWDSNNGKYVISGAGLEKEIQRAASNPLPSARSMVAGLAPTTGLSSGPSRSQLIAMRGQYPKEMVNFVNAANVNLANAVELGHVDPSTPAGTDVELRNWYGQEIPLASMAPKGNNVNPELEMEKMFQKAEQGLEQFRQKALATPVPVRTEGLLGTITEGEAGPKGYNSYYGDGQGKNGADKFAYGFDKPVTEMTMAEAIDIGRRVMIPMTRGKIGNSDPSLGTSAIGAYQFTQETLAELGPDVFGKDWESVTLTPENQNKLARALVAKTGGDREKLIKRWPSLKGKI